MTGADVLARRERASEPEAGPSAHAVDVLAQHAVRLERDIKEFVMQTVRLDFGEQDLARLDWNTPEAARLIDRSVFDGFRLLKVAR